MNVVVDLLSDVGKKLIVLAIVAVGGSIWAALQTDPDPVLLRFLVALSVWNALAVAYFYFKWQDSNQAAQQLSEHTLRELERVSELLEQSPYFSRRNRQVSPAHRLARLLDITDQRFDKEQQDIVFEFTNKGESPFYIRKVVYSDKTFGIPVDAIDYERRVRNSRGVVIPFDGSNAHVECNEDFTLRLHLKQSWQAKDVNAKIGKMGYLDVFVDYGEFENERLPYSI